MDIWSDFFCLGCLVCTIPQLLKSVRTTRVKSGASGGRSRQADIEGLEIGGFDAVRSCSEAFLGSQRSPMTSVTIQCTMIHSGKGQGTSKVHLDRLQKPQEIMREASAQVPSVHCAILLSNPTVHSHCAIPLCKPIVQSLCEIPLCNPTVQSHCALQRCCWSGGLVSTSVLAHWFSTLVQYISPVHLSSIVICQ